MIEVSGPGVERTVPNEGAGIMLAQHHACHADVGDTITFYVRSDGKVTVRVTRHDGGVVITERV